MLFNKFQNDTLANIKVVVQGREACLGNSVLDGLRADYRDSDNLVAGDRDDLAAVAAK